MDNLIVPHKRCSHCDNTYPATTEYFGPQKNHKDGLKSWCRTCKRTAERERMREKRKDPEFHEREIQYNRAYHARPEVKQHAFEYGREYRQRPDARQARHEYEIARWADPLRRAKRSVVRKAWAATDNGRIVLNVHNARRHARLLNAPGKYTAADVEKQYKSQRGRCWWCGKKVGNEYDVDHVVPLVRGGSNGPENIVISCAHCNRSKHDKTPQEWAGRLF